MPASRYYRVGLMALAGAFIGFRCWGLTDTCLWFDEIFSVHAAEHSWSGLLTFVGQDLIHPPLFYALLKLWIAVGGEGVFWLRLLPLVFSAIALIPFLLLCKEIRAGWPATLLALAFLAVNGSAIKYSQEVRMYSLLMCLSLFSVWLFFRFAERGIGLLVLTAVNVLLVYCHYFGWIVVMTEILAVVVFQRVRMRQFVLASVGVVISFLPWIWWIWKENFGTAALEQNLGWIARPNPGDVITIALAAIEPFYYQQSSIDPDSHLYITLPIVVVILVSIVVYAVDRREPDGHLRSLALFAIVPPVITFVLSWLLPVSIWGSRHLTIMIGPILILIGVIITRLQPNAVRYAAIGILGVLFVGAFVERSRADRPLYVWCAWERLEPIIGGPMNDPAPQTLYVFEDLVAYHFWFAGRNRSDLQIVKVDGVPDMTEDNAYFLPRGFDGVRRVNANEVSGQHFWIAFRDMKWDERHPPLNVLIDHGYKIGEPQAIEADGLKAFLVEVSK